MAGATIKVFAFYKVKVAVPIVYSSSVIDVNIGAPMMTTAAR